MNLGDMLQDLLKDLESDLKSGGSGKVVKKDIGQVSEDLREAFLDLHEEKAALQDAIELRIEQMEREIKRRMQRDFEDQMDLLQKKHDHLWQHVYEELQLEDRDKNYSINRKNGIVSEKMRINL